MLWDERFLSTSRGHVLVALRRGPRTVDELARPLGLTRNAIRSHLATLERDGLVQSTLTRPGTSKPSSLYELTPAAEHLFSQAYAPVLRQLLNVLREQLPAGGLDDVLHEAGRRMARDQDLAEADLQQRQCNAAMLARALAMLEQLGGVAEAEIRGEMAVIHSCSCPLLATVPAHPELCHMTEVLLQQVLRAPVREKCDRSHPPRCCFEVDLSAGPSSHQGSVSPCEETDQ
jgi:predicted ArsR family transcriptional regulator